MRKWVSSEIAIDTEDGYYRVGCFNNEDREIFYTAKLPTPLEALASARWLAALLNAGEEALTAKTQTCQQEDSVETVDYLARNIIEYLVGTSDKLQLLRKDDSYGKIMKLRNILRPLLDS